MILNLQLRIVLGIYYLKFMYEMSRPECITKYLRWMTSNQNNSNFWNS